MVVIERHSYLKLLLKCMKVVVNYIKLYLINTSQSELGVWSLGAVSSDLSKARGDNG